VEVEDGCEVCWAWGREGKAVYVEEESLGSEGTVGSVEYAAGDCLAGN
jgi:hypothetical protein